MKLIGDSMFFPNPIVWIGYKVKAYANTNGRIVTLNDLREHCKSPTYICSKRFHFLNKQLKTYGLDLLNDSSLNGDNLLSDLILPDSVIYQVCNDENFMRSWNNYEYFEIGGRVAKWENYFYVDLGTISSIGQGKF